MTWIRRYKLKKLISKISIDSNFTFSSYAWLCVIHCFHRLLCWINSRVREFSWKLLSFHTKMILAWFLWGSVFLRGELRKYAKKSSFDNFESALYSTSVSMPLSKIVILPWCATSGELIFSSIILATISSGRAPPRCRISCMRTPNSVCISTCCSIRSVAWTSWQRHVWARRLARAVLPAPGLPKMIKQVGLECKNLSSACKTKV